jgi:hypothetical protein
MQDAGDFLAQAGRQNIRYLLFKKSLATDVRGRPTRFELRVHGFAPNCPEFLKYESCVLRVAQLTKVQAAAMAPASE